MATHQNPGKSRLAMGGQWYRRKPGSEAFPVRIYRTGDVKYVWLCDPSAIRPERCNLEECMGEFIARIRSPNHRSPPE
jgi:hypothetical protein